jgi:PLP dependent protein
MSFIIENIVSIKSRIRAAAENSGRNPNEIKLLLGTKTVLAQNIITAIKTGEILIGENKIQEVIPLLMRASRSYPF